MDIFKKFFKTEYYITKYYDILVNEVLNDLFSFSLALYTLELLESRPCLDILSEVSEVGILHLGEVSVAPETELGVGL